MLDKNIIFDQTQEEIKKILQGEPYNYTPQKAEEWNHSMIVESPKRAKSIMDDPQNQSRTPDQLAKLIIQALKPITYFHHNNPIPNLEQNPNITVKSQLGADRGSNQLESILTEDTQSQIEDDDSGIEAFKIFLKIVNKEKLFFMKRNYLNLGEYLYFFYTDPIYSNKKAMDKFEEKRSLVKAYKTIKEIFEKKLTFFWGVKDNMIEYGFMDNDKYVAYKVGKFKATNDYIRNSLPRNQCMIYVRDRMKEANINNVKLLHMIKKDLSKLWTTSNGEIKILDEFRIRKSFPRNIIKPEEQNEELLTRYIDQFKDDFTWNKKASAWCVLTDANIHFYIRLWD